MKIQANLHKIGLPSYQKSEGTTTDNYEFIDVPETFIGGYNKIETLHAIEIDGSKYVPFTTVIINPTRFELWLDLLEGIIRDNERGVKYRMYCSIEFSDTNEVNALINGDSKKYKTSIFALNDK